MSATTTSANHRNAARAAPARAAPGSLEPRAASPRSARAGHTSTAVATSFSVELARRIGLTLIGNIKADSFWVYNDPGRIVQE